MLPAYCRQFARATQSVNPTSTRIAQSPRSTSNNQVHDCEFWSRCIVSAEVREMLYNACTCTFSIKNLSGTRQTTILFCRLQSSTVFSALCAYYHACTSSCEFGIVSARVKSRYHIIDRRCHRRPIAMNGRVITRRRDVVTRLLPTYTDDVGVLAIEPALAVW